MRRTWGSLGAGAALLLALALVAAFAPWIAPAAPETQDLSRRLEGPGRENLLGRDDLGRDVLSRLIWGGRISLAAGLIVVALSATIGALLGAAAAYAGGLSDLALVALLDLFLSFPGILLAIALVAVLGPRLSNLILALCFIGWVPYARLARGAVLRLARLESFEAARSLGAGAPRLVCRHLIPGLTGPILVQAALGLGGVILSEAGLSFLGLGVPPPAPSWGSMLRSGAQNLLDAPHLTVVPAAAIVLAVLGANLLGEGLRRRLDPAGTAGSP